MANVTTNVNWATITIDTKNGTVFVQEKWKYTWLTAATIKAWTSAQKKQFHTQADKNIWQGWSNKLTLKVAGTSKFASSFNSKGIKVNFDIKKVTAGHHWTVRVTKISAGAFKRSNVDWNGRIINLDTNDLNEREICRRAAGPASPAGKVPEHCTKQKAIEHEYGHTVGNTVVLGRGDEYRAGHTNRGDQGSMMNAGHQLRKRHFRTLVEELNKMIPDTTFTVKNIR